MDTIEIIPMDSIPLVLHVGGGLTEAVCELSRSVLTAILSLQGCKEMLCPRQPTEGEMPGFNLLMELLRGDH